MNHSEGGGDSTSAPSHTVSAGDGVDVACLNAFLEVPFNVTYARLYSDKFLLLLLWFLLLVFVLLFRVVLPPVLLVVSVNLLRPVVNVSMSARLVGALLWVELLHARS